MCSNARMSFSAAQKNSHAARSRMGATRKQEAVCVRSHPNRDSQPERRAGARETTPLVIRSSWR